MSWRLLQFRLKHPGRERLCNICGWRGSAFYPVEGDPDVACPNCLSQPRHRLLKQVLDELSLPRPGSAILHVSPKGEERFAKWLRKRARTYLSIDKGGIWNDFHDGGAMLQMDLTDLRLPDDSYDLVICSHVLENIEDDAKAIRAMFRVVVPGGVAALPVQLYGEVTKKVAMPSLEDYFHVWHPGNDYFLRYEAVGFEVRLHLPRQADMALLRLHDRLVVPICLKPTIEPDRSRPDHLLRVC